MTREIERSQATVSRLEREYLAARQDVERAAFGTLAGRIARARADELRRQFDLAVRGHKQMILEAAAAMRPIA